MSGIILSNKDTKLKNTQPCPGGINWTVGDTDTSAVDFHAGRSYVGSTMEHSTAGVLEKRGSLRRVKFKMDRS